MIIPIVAMWAMSLPAGYVVGKVYQEEEDLGDTIALIAALIPPFAAVLAVSMILKAESK